MKVLGYLMIVFSLSTQASETAKCFNSHKLKAHEDMHAAIVAKQYDVFVQRFNQLCEKYAARLECRVEKSNPDQANDRMREMVKGDKCSEVVRVPGETEDSLYFMTDKKKPLK